MLVYLIALNIWYITSIGNNDTSILWVLKITVEPGMCLVSQNHFHVGCQCLCVCVRVRACSSIS